MSKPIRFSPVALDNSLEIYDNLEVFKEGLGDRIYDRLREAYDQIRSNEESFQSLDEEHNKRRAFLKLTKKLHYRIIYEIVPSYIEIQAIKRTYRG